MNFAAFDGALTLSSGVDARTMPADRFMNTYRAWVASRSKREDWEQVETRERLAIQRDEAYLTAAALAPDAPGPRRASRRGRRRTRRGASMAASTGETTTAEVSA